MSTPKNNKIRYLIICLLVIAIIGAFVSEKVWNGSELPTSMSNGDTVNTEKQDEIRFLRLEDGKLVVYDGENNLLDTLDYDVLVLPQTWQQQLQNGGISFANEEELLSALDSLDEYDQ